MIFKRKLRENMKKKMIISTCFVLALFIGFLLGRCNSYVMNTPISGSYTEKELQSKKDHFSWNWRMIHINIMIQVQMKMEKEAMKC